MLPVVQLERKRHVPPEPQDLVQHWTLLGSFGQNPGRDVPPPEEQVVVAKQTPGSPFAVQGPLTAAWAERLRAITTREEVKPFIGGLLEQIELKNRCRYEPLFIP